MEPEKILEQLKAIALRWGKFSIFWNAIIVYAFASLPSPEKQKSWWIALLELSPRSIGQSFLSLVDSPLSILVVSITVACTSELGFRFAKRWKFASEFGGEKSTTFIEQQYEKCASELSSLSEKTREEEIYRIEKEIGILSFNVRANSIVHKGVWIFVIISLFVCLKTLSPVDVILFIAFFILFSALFFKYRQDNIKNLLPSLIIRAFLLRNKKLLPDA